MARLDITSTAWRNGQGYSLPGLLAGLILGKILNFGLPWVSMSVKQRHSKDLFLGVSWKWYELIYGQPWKQPATRASWNIELSVASLWSWSEWPLSLLQGQTAGASATLIHLLHLMVFFVHSTHFYISGLAGKTKQKDIRIWWLFWPHKDSDTLLFILANENLKRKLWVL